MSPLWTSDAAATATGGALQGPPWQATGVSIDTRTLEPGDLFVALRDVRDGHDFVAAALDAGAAAALVSHRPDGVADDAPLLLVDDVLAGLNALGHAGRARTKARVIGVTGSAGKTSTKEMLKTVLDRQGATHASVASYNNHWGVPLTLARMPVDTDFAVIEIGMSNPGEIAPLARLSAPHVVLITTVAAAHLEAFEDLDAIAREKASIIDGLGAGGTAILPGDLPTSAILTGTAEAAGAKVVTFGDAPRNTCHLTDVSLSGDATHATAHLSDQALPFDVRAPGGHFAMNALATLAAVEALGGDVVRAAADMALWQPPGGRGFREWLDVDGGRIELIDDAFNANPASMDAALAVLAMTDPAGRRVAVLGDMLELGPTEAALHRAIADHKAMAGIAMVHTVGPRMAALHAALPAEKRGHRAETADALLDHLGDLAAAGDVLLVKGSKSSRVSLIVDGLRKLGHPPVET